MEHHVQPNTRPSIRLSFANSKITTREEGEAFIRKLVDADLLFHFEDPPLDIIDIRTGALTFTTREAIVLTLRVSELYDLDWDTWLCPIGFALHLIGHDDQ